MLLRIVQLLCLTLLCSCAAVDLPTRKEDAVAAYEQGQYREAADQFASLLEDMPKDADLWFRLGNAQAHAGRPREAVTAYENALLRNPELAKAWFNMGVIYMQQALKTFVDIEQYVEPEDEVGKRAAVMCAELIQILQGSNATPKSTD